MVQGSKTLQYLRKSQLLALPGIANHFLETATSLLTFAVTSQGSSPPSAGTSAALLGKLLQSVPCPVTVADHFQQFPTFCWCFCSSDRYAVTECTLPLDICCYQSGQLSTFFWSLCSYLG